MKSYTDVNRVGFHVWYIMSMVQEHGETVKYIYYNICWNYMLFLES